MKVITIGRSSANDVKINDPYVGQHHCQVIEDNGNFRLIDLNSKNGTYVNGMKIKGEVMLYSTDIVKIGNTVLPWKNYLNQETQRPVKLPMPTVEPVKKDTIPPEEPVEKSRHGFITFWLWAGIICSILSCTFSLFTCQGYTNLGYLGMKLITAGYSLDNFVANVGNYVIIMQICLVLSTIIGIVCYSYLLKWQKIGFWLIIANGILFGIINIIMMNHIESEYQALGIILYTQPMIIGSIVGMVGPLILWAVLQIKKNGVKFWDNLE
ncbi:MAG: FHA domain-containing protein [Prevotellaceae bacterium]|jgi:hypothetical protein|nr:FHA domain-containing protein [Prevotellaceae bacterium]